MSLTEFAVIEKYFKRQHRQRDGVIVGIGDDAALLDIPPNYHLAVSADSLVAGVHFLEDWAPQDIGYRALAVNLSDMAAMAAVPKWMTLTLSLPQIDEDWLALFMQGFFKLADQHEVCLIGGDLTRGPLVIGVQIMGLVQPGKAIYRNKAKVGDLIYVTGELGAAGFALEHLKTQQSISAQDEAVLMQRLLRPTPRINPAQVIRGLVNAGIDISDGLAADLNHICIASQAGATVHIAALPICPVLKKYLSADQIYQLALTAGDDYELCFTVEKHRQDLVEDLLTKMDCPFAQVGIIEQDPALRFLRDDGTVYQLKKAGYQHFDGGNTDES